MRYTFAVECVPQPVHLNWFILYMCCRWLCNITILEPWSKHCYKFSVVDHKQLLGINARYLCNCSGSLKFRDVSKMIMLNPTIMENFTMHSLLCRSRPVWLTFFCGIWGYFKEYWWSKNFGPYQLPIYGQKLQWKSLGNKSLVTIILQNITMFHRRRKKRFGIAWGE